MSRQDSSGRWTAEGVLVALLSVGACSGPSAPAVPTPASNYEGTWTGSSLVQSCAGYDDLRGCVFNVVTGERKSVETELRLAAESATQLSGALTLRSLSAGPLVFQVSGQVDASGHLVLGFATSVRLTQDYSLSDWRSNPTITRPVQMEGGFSIQCACGLSRRVGTTRYALSNFRFAGRAKRN